jgi:hypothetical protein
MEVSSWENKKKGDFLPNSAGTWWNRKLHWCSYIWPVTRNSMSSCGCFNPWCTRKSSLYVCFPGLRKLECL